MNISKGINKVSMFISRFSLLSENNTVNTATLLKTTSTLCTKAPIFFLSVSQGDIFLKLHNAVVSLNKFMSQISVKCLQRKKQVFPERSLHMQFSEFFFFLTWLSKCEREKGTNCSSENICLNTFFCLHSTF